MHRSPARPRVVDAITAAARARVALICGARSSGRSTALGHWVDAASPRARIVVCSDLDAVLGAVRDAAELPGAAETTIVVDDVDQVVSPAGLPAVLDALESTPRARLVGVVGWDGLWLAERLAMTSEVATVDEATLSLTRSEVARELEVVGTAPGAALVAAATDAFAGWPPAVRAMTAVLAFEGFGDAGTLEDELRFVDRVREVLAAGLARRLSGAAVDSLESLALVPWCSETGAANVLGRDSRDAAEILAELEAVGLGAWRAVAGRRRFRLSAVVRGLAPRTAASQEATRALHGRIAVELARDRVTGDALRHALASEDPEVFEQVLDATLTDALRSEPLDLATACTAAVRAKLVRSAGARAVVDLVLWRVTGAAPAAQGGSSPTVDGSRGDPLLDVAESLRQLELGNVSIARRLASRADPTTGRAAGLTGLTRAEILAHTSPQTREESDRGTIVDAFRQVARQHPETEVALAALGYVALLRCLDGDVVEARRELDGVPEALALRWGAGPWGRGWRLAKACSALEDRGTTMPATTADEVAADEWGSDSSVAATVEATARLHAGDLPRAMHTARAALQAPTGWLGPWVRDQLEAIRLTVAGGRSDRPQAAVLFAVISDAAAARIAMARCELRRGDAHRALATATDLLRRNELTTRNRVEALLVIADAAGRSGLGRESERALRDAADVCSRHGLTTPWYFASPEVVETAAALLGTRADDLLPAGPVLSSETVLPVLTPRELVVLGTRARSRSLQEVAVRLTVSQNTVKTQLHSAYRKLGVSNATQAVARAIDLGLIADVDLPRRGAVHPVPRAGRGRLVG
jgi:DNA-binding CsgD family transcriptional regulator